VKLIDFNMSKCTEFGKRSTFCGTSLYLAPEVVLQSTYEGVGADIWSLGVCLYVMVTGEFPFDSIANSLAEKYTIPTYLSPLCADLLSNILKVDTSKRFTMQQIRNHAWAKKPSHCSPWKPCCLSTPSSAVAKIEPNTNDTTKIDVV